MRCSAPHRVRARLATTALALLGASAVQAEGLNWNDHRSLWSRWQPRVDWTPPLPAGASRSLLPPAHWSTPGLRLLGDTPLGSSLAGASGEGLRATAGVVLTPQPGMRLPQGAALARTDAVPASFAASTTPWRAAGYVGLGYSHRPTDSTWRFNADVGLLGSGLRLDGLSAGQWDSPLRELRLSPLLQVGASYQF